MTGIIKVPFGDEMVSVIELQFEPVKEPWAEYELMDGGKFRIRSTIHRIFWQVDENGAPRYDEQGQAMLLVHHNEQMVQNVMKA